MKTPRFSSNLLACTLLAATLMLGCKSSTTSPESSSDVTGYLFDMDTREPIVGATVTLDEGKTTTTDAEGKYRFANAGYGTHHLVAHALGFDPLDVSAQLQNMGGDGLKRHARVVAYLPFTSTVNDSSENHWTVLGTATFGTDRFGEPNSTLLTGESKSFLTIASADKLNFGSTTDFAFSYWIKLPNKSGTALFPIITKLAGSQSNGLGYAVDIFLQQNGIYVPVTVLSTSKGSVNSERSPISVNGQWQLVTVNVSRSENKIYVAINDEPSHFETDQSVSGNLTNTSVVTIGGPADGIDFAIDDVRIFSGQILANDQSLLFHEKGF